VAGASRNELIEHTAIIVVDCFGWPIGISAGGSLG
jgi:hypothetical protein